MSDAENVCTSAPGNCHAVMAHSIRALAPPEAVRREVQGGGDE